MMTVHKIGAADVVGYADYLMSRDDEAKRRGDYYLGRDGVACEAQGQWHGKAAAELGLSGAVTRDDMLRVWEGRDPRTGELLIRRGQDGHHVAAVDCTFSAPKSVSVVWALSDVEMRAAIEDAQDRAVAVAIDHIERNAPLVRRRIDGQITHEVAGGVAVARFRHHTSRLSAEQYARGVAPDPQLHDHCAIANLAVRRDGALAANGKWAAIDSRELFRIAQEAGAVYRAELAVGLIELGYSIVRSGRFFELSGVPAQARDVFSARHREVQQAVRQFILVHGRAPSYVETRGLVMLTRNAKAQEHEPAFAQWDQRARAAGIDPAAIRALPDHRQRADAVPIPTSNEDTVRQVVAELTDPSSPYALTREAAATDERALRIAVADAAQGRIRGAYVDELRGAVEQSPELVRLDAAHWTTRPMIEMEQAVLADARVRQLGRWYPRWQPSAWPKPRATRRRARVCGMTHRGHPPAPWNRLRSAVPCRLRISLRWGRRWAAQRWAYDRSAPRRRATPVARRGTRRRERGTFACDARRDSRSCRDARCESVSSPSPDTGPPPRRRQSGGWPR
jgi:conjugative relaxase-like TrwC/TraI family protein